MRNHTNPDASVVSYQDGYVISVAMGGLNARGVVRCAGSMEGIYLDLACLKGLFISQRLLDAADIRVVAPREPSMGSIVVTLLGFPAIRMDDGWWKAGNKDPMTWLVLAQLLPERDWLVRDGWSTLQGKAL